MQGFKTRIFLIAYLTKQMSATAEPSQQIHIRALIFKYLFKLNPFNSAANFYDFIAVDYLSVNSISEYILWYNIFSSWDRWFSFP